MDMIIKNQAKTTSSRTTTTAAAILAVARTKSYWFKVQNLIFSYNGIQSSIFSFLLY